MRGLVEDKEEHIAIIQDLLKYKADPSIQCLIEGSGQKRSLHKGNSINYPVYVDLLDLIRELFSPAYFEALINESRKRKSWNLLRLFDYR